MAQIDPTAAADPPLESDAPPAHLEGGYRAYALTVLSLIYLVNFLDRQVINILAEPIKRDLHLADWQLGLMSGLAFAGIYTVLGFPVARLADRGDRPRILAIALAVWSLCTAACGLARTFPQLLLTRFGVGVGEAGGTPPAHSLIMDYVPPAKRSSAFAIYGLGAPIGGLLGMAFGGLIADAWGWRHAFMFAGVPGLLLALLAAFTLREPRRAHALQRKGEKAAPWSAQLRNLSSRRSWIYLQLAVTLNAVPTTAFGAFLAPFLLRNHGVELADIAARVGPQLGLDLKVIGLVGLTLGPISGVMGALGMWLGGVVADKAGKADTRRYAIGAGWASTSSTVALVIALIAPSVWVALVLYGLSYFFVCATNGAAYASIYSVVPARMRAFSSAIGLFMGNIVGLGLGALAVGIASDVFAKTLGPAEGLRWALLSFSMFPVIAGACFWRGSRTVRQEAV